VQGSRQSSGNGNKNLIISLKKPPQTAQPMEILVNNKLVADPDTHESSVKRSNDSGMGQRKNIFTSNLEPNKFVKPSGIAVKSAHFKKTEDHSKSSEIPGNASTPYTAYVGRPSNLTASILMKKS